MNKSQAEKKVYAFHAVFRVDVNDVNPFQNPTRTSPIDHFLDPQSMPKIVNEYDQEIPQSQIQTIPWHREEEPLNHHETPGGQIKQSNQLSLPHQDDCNTRMDTK